MKNRLSPGSNALAPAVFALLSTACTPEGEFDLSNGHAGPAIVSTPNNGVTHVVELTGEKIQLIAREGDTEIHDSVPLEVTDEAGNPLIAILRNAKHFYEPEAGPSTIEIINAESQVWTKLELPLFLHHAVAEAPSTIHGLNSKQERSKFSLVLIAWGETLDENGKRPDEYHFLHVFEDGSHVLEPAGSSVDFPMLPEVIPSAKNDQELHSNGITCVEEFSLTGEPVCAITALIPSAVYIIAVTPIGEGRNAFDLVWISTDIPWSGSEPMLSGPHSPDLSTGGTLWVFNDGTKGSTQSSLVELDTMTNAVLNVVPTMKQNDRGAVSLVPVGTAISGEAIAEPLLMVTLPDYDVLCFQGIDQVGISQLTSEVCPIGGQNGAFRADFIDNYPGTVFN